MANLVDYLIRVEEKYSNAVKAKKHVDRRIIDERGPGKMVGGNRMGPPHNYAESYAPLIRKLQKEIPEEELTIVEVGVLHGTGLALWCELFPKATVIGLDVDLSYFGEAAPKLIDVGAFRFNRPQLLTFNQLDPKGLRTLLNKKKVHFYIDDALHTDTAISNCLVYMEQFLAEKAVCIIEDNWTVYPKLLEMFSCDWFMDRHVGRPGKQELTTLVRGL